METLLPSEVARLVYGYLIEQNCGEAADKFLRTSPHLKECLSASRKGKKFQTRFEGKNLVSILDILSQVKAQDDAELTDDTERGSSSEYDLTTEEEFKAKEETDESIDYSKSYDYSDCGETSRNKSKTDCQRISRSNDNSSPHLTSTHLFGEDVYRIDDRMDSDSQNESNMEAISFDIDAGTENSVNSENVNHFATSKRMKLVDNSLNADDVAFVMPEVEVIDLDSEDPEEVEDAENFNFNSSCISSSFDHILADKAPENCYVDKFHNTATSIPTSSLPLNCNLPQAGPVRVPVPNIHTTIHLRPVNLNSAYTGPTLVKAAITSHLANLQNSQPRFIPQPPMRLIHPAPNYNMWVRKPNTVMPNTLIHNHHTVNQQVIQTSSFGAMPQIRNDLPQGGVQVVSKNIVTQMVNGPQQSVCQSFISNHTVVRPSVLLTSSSQNSIHLINPQAHHI